LGKSFFKNFCIQNQKEKETKKSLQLTAWGERLGEVPVAATTPPPPRRSSPPRCSREGRSQKFVFFIIRGPTILIYIKI
jgi:hypothetical protein